jgi:hypothetical protein
MNAYQQRKAKSHKTLFCWAYQEDLDQAYAFYCSRYENISYEEFMNLGFFEVKKKMSSIPKNEPLYDIIKSRTINLAKIKNKDERAYWQEMKQINEIPQIYLPMREINRRLQDFINRKKGI